MKVPWVEGQRITNPEGSQLAKSFRKFANIVTSIFANIATSIVTPEAELFSKNVALILGIVEELKPQEKTSRSFLRNSSPLDALRVFVLKYLLYCVNVPVV